MDNIPLEVRWLFNDLMKTAGEDGIKCTFINPLTDKVIFHFLFNSASHFRYNEVIFHFLFNSASHFRYNKVIFHFLFNAGSHFRYNKVIFHFLFNSGSLC